MKILIVRTWPQYLDVKKRTYNIQELGLAKALVRKGNICDLLFWTDKQNEDVDISVNNVAYVHVYYRKGVTFLKNTVYKKCEEIFDKYDILQAAEYNQIQSWILAKKRPGQTVIYHGPYYSPFNKRFNLICKPFDLFFKRIYIKNKTKFIVKSTLAKDFLMNKGISSDCVSTIGVGIDVEMLCNNTAECNNNELIYKKMKADVCPLKVLYIGAMEERRDIPFLLNVFKKVLLQVEGAKFYMVGTGSTNYCNNVKKIIGDLNIDDKVVWQEKIEQKYLSDIYRMADFFLLPTEYEIFGMVLLEAMYYQTVVLTTRNGGSTTLMENGKNGFLFEHKDVKDWSNKIVEIYQNTNRMKQIKQEAHKQIKDNFTWDCLADRFIERYQNKLNGR